MLFACDWSYGKLYAVHLKPKGSTYQATFEEFASAKPFPITDLLINPADGAMYIAFGGRRVQSGLYRVTTSAMNPPPRQNRFVREKMNGRPAGLWKHISRRGQK